MKFPGICLLLAVLFSPLAALQAQRQSTPYEVTKITPLIVRTPEYQFTGEQKPPGRAQRWLEVEVDFSTQPTYTDELTVRYYILLGNQLLTGEVTHVNIAAGRDHRSVMYVAPNTIDRLLGGKVLTMPAIENVGIQLVQKGQVLATRSAKETRAAGQWWQNMAQTSGLVLNKNETPFAPLYWDRYEAIRSTGR